LTLPLALVILPGLAWLATCLPGPDMPDKGGLPPCFASWARGCGVSVVRTPARGLSGMNPAGGRAADSRRTRRR
jgi:hypothetical protein